MSVGHRLTGLRVASASVRERRLGKGTRREAWLPGDSGGAGWGRDTDRAAGPCGCDLGKSPSDEHVGPRPEPERTPAPGGLRAGQQVEEPAAGVPSGAGPPGDQGGMCPPHPRGRRDLQPQPRGPGPSSRVGSWGSEDVVCSGGAPPQSTRSCEGPRAPRVLPDCSDPLSGHSSLSLKGVGSQRQAG